MNIMLLPLIIIIFGSLTMVLIIAYKRSLAVCHWLTGIILVSALAAQCILFNPESVSADLLLFSPLNQFLCQLTLLIVLIVYWPLKQWLSQHSSSPTPFYLLLLWTTIGALVMILANHFALLFMGLELLSLSLIGLIAYQCPQFRNQPADNGSEISSEAIGIEAAVKYLILSAIASAVILLGFALIYIDIGSLSLTDLHQVAQGKLLPPWLIYGAIFFILGGLFFKLSIAPCHLWFADLLQGAPTPVAALLSTISKLAVFSLLFKLLLSSQWIQITIVAQVIGAVAIISMLLGNLLALRQQNIYRLLAYSSIAHFGYLLIIMLLGNNSHIASEEILLIYMVAYLLSLSGLFALLSLMPDQDTLEKLQGLLWRQPLLGICFMLLILSLAGIPLTIGFVAKFYLLLATVEQQLWLLIGALVLGSIIGLFYYFNLLLTIAKKTASKNTTAIKRIPIVGSVVITLFIVLLGLYPQPLAQFISQLVEQ
ncbi:MAG: NADH-quinone oxidoreductase subunit N [Psychrobium sp.]|nr:NADH-quinone oxidoreductase subunit N [Psychrobium sp.]